MAKRKANALIKRSLSARQIASYIAKINTEWRSAVASIIEVGRLLNEIAERCEHGQYETLIDSGRLPFGVRAAHMIRSIANHQLIPKRKYISFLPPAWGTLYLLSRLDLDEFKHRISDRSIHPALEQGEVRGWFQKSVADRVAKIGFDAKQLGKFSLILADPPWDDEFGRSDRSIENHYPTMHIEDICALPVSEIVHEHAMLFLWATPSMLQLAFNTCEAWGFKYRTKMIWRKPSIGLGKYVRQRHEALLICRRGEHPAPDPENLPESVIDADRTEHSEKPEIFHEIIERMYPGAEKIELFQRGVPRQGWVAWGAEAQSQEAAE
jgi:N6-adenosine-specific RNA methylase IME4